MCSNRSNVSYKELQDDYSVSGSCLKKQKKDKVRRRGPGVAELEKIRLQEEIKSPIPHSPSSSSSLRNIDHTLFALHQPSETSLYTTYPIFRPPVYPFSSYFVNGSFPKDKQHSSSSSLHHQMMNHPNPSPGSGRFYQFIELPSNQRSCVDINVSQCLEEENKLVNARKPWHFLKDTSKASVGPISREEKRNQSIDIRLISPVKDSGTTICNPIAIDSSISIESSPLHYPSLQYEQEEEEFDENMQCRSKKPFYSFISSDAQNNSDQEQRPCDPSESDADHGIDLNLKL